MTSPISTIQELQARYHLWLTKPLCWRTVKQPVQGEINGLPGFRGLAVATNGIHVALITSADALLVGHLEWFVKDPREAQTDLWDAPTVSQSKQPKVVNLEEFEELFV